MVKVKKKKISYVLKRTNHGRIGQYLPLRRLGIVGRASFLLFQPAAGLLSHNTSLPSTPEAERRT
jgi:hypothetical protein